jgi:hypothetical protein
MERVVLPELLDELPARDESALRSRRDIRRLNRLMGHPRLMARALQDNLPPRQPLRIVELGAGDGLFLLSVARLLRGEWPGVEATLVDRLDVLQPNTRVDFERLGWRVRVEIAEASQWLRQPSAQSSSAIVSNLFLHQFRAEPLAEMLELAARSSQVFIALEPRRSWLSRFLGRFLWFAGCGPVTRHDGLISIRAGFVGNDLSALWPDTANWELAERPAGLFTHLFIARRKD